MFGKIIYISNNEAHVEVSNDTAMTTNIMNMQYIFLLLYGITDFFSL